MNTQVGGRLGLVAKKIGSTNRANYMPRTEREWAATVAKQAGSKGDSSLPTSSISVNDRLPPTWQIAM